MSSISVAVRLKGGGGLKKPPPPPPPIGSSQSLTTPLTAAPGGRRRRRRRRPCASDRGAGHGGPGQANQDHCLRPARPHRRGPDSSDGNLRRALPGGASLASQWHRDGRSRCLDKRDKRGTYHCSTPYCRSHPMPARFLSKPVVFSSHERWLISQTNFGKLKFLL